MLKIALSITQAFIIPPRCVLCERQLMNPYPVCRRCYRQFTPLTNYCDCCGYPDIDTRRCGPCLSQPPPFEVYVPIFMYQDELKALIHHYKFQQQLYLSKVFAKIMRGPIQRHYRDKTYPSLLIAMPSHPKRTRERGFNPALEIAKYLSLYCQIPLEYKAVKRVKSSPPQSSLPLKLRATNVRAAFRCERQLPHHIAVVDDVMTSGETLKSLCRMLKRHGATQIDLWVLARTPISQ